MFTAIYSIGKVNGAVEIWVSGFFICSFIFAAICLLFKVNRTKKGIITISLCLLAAEIICDIAWFFIYYYSGSYYNYGVRGLLGLLLWPALLIFAGIVGTRRNVSRS